MVWKPHQSFLLASLLILPELLLRVSLQPLQAPLRVAVPVVCALETQQCVQTLVLLHGHSHLEPFVSLLCHTCVVPCVVPHVNDHRCRVSPGPCRVLFQSLVPSLVSFPARFSRAQSSLPEGLSFPRMIDAQQIEGPHRELEALLRGAPLQSP